jgi:hypothetical protein
MKRFLNSVVMVLAFAAGGHAAEKAVSVSTAVPVSAAVPVSTSTWKRIDGTVQTIARGEYTVTLQTATGAGFPIRWTQRMRPFLNGIALRWRDIRSGDSITILAADQPTEILAGSRDMSEWSATVKSVSPRDRTFQVQTENKFVVECLDTPALKMTIDGRPIAYDELRPGQVIQIRRE